MNLKTLETVVLTPTIDRTLILLDPYFDGEPSNITSGLRTHEKQLAIIVEKVAHHGMAKLYPEYFPNLGHPYDLKVRVDGNEWYWWQRAWSKLLNIQDIVNPPVPAEVLFDYFRPGSTVNKKGMVIDISNHMRGHSFDIGMEGRGFQKLERVKKAVEEGKCFIHGYLEETVNGAVHVDCVPVA